MRKWLKASIWILAAAIITIAILNIEVTTLQGVDYKINVIRMPLYFKVLDFFDRHYNYSLLTGRITAGAKTDKEKVSRLLEWTHANIRKVPEGFPVVDDHVWHIIIRGYGTYDQSADVFTTLCNYAGLEAFFLECRPKDKTKEISVSFVKVGGEWTVLDPYYGASFVDASGNFVRLEDIKDGRWTMKALERPAIQYQPFFDNLPAIKGAGLVRSTIQSPLNRFLFEIKKRWKGNSGLKQQEGD